jgi:hypothetical protein
MMILEIKMKIRDSELKPQYVHGVKSGTWTREKWDIWWEESSRIAEATNLEM